MPNTELSKYGRDIAGMKKDIEYLTKGQDELKKSIKDFIDTADKRYASKRVETFIWGVFGVGATFMVIKVLELQ